jgi:hypothetical protein
MNWKYKGLEKKYFFSKSLIGNLHHPFEIRESKVSAEINACSILTFQKGRRIVHQDQRFSHHTTHGGKSLGTEQPQTLGGWKSTNHLNS